MAALAVVYGGIWALGARSTLRGVDALAAELRAAGWQVNWDDRRLRGFPSRLDLTIDGPEVTTPSGAEWRAPFIQRLQLTYQRDRAILAFADSQSLTLGDRTFDIRSGALRASVHGDAVTAEAERLALSWQGREIAAGPVLAAVRPAPGASGTFDLFVRAEGATLDGEPLGEVVLNGQATLGAPLSRTALPDIRDIEITGLSAAGVAATEALTEALSGLSPALGDALDQRQ